MFPLLPVPAGNLAASAGQEAYEEANAFSGKQWTELDRDFIHRFRDAVFWFRPDAFHYYLPAFMRAAEVGRGCDELFVGNLLTLLNHDPDPKLAEFRRERWSLLTGDQVTALLEWLLALRARTSPAEPDWDRLESAIAIVETRAWWA